MEPIAAFAAQNANGEIHGHVVAVVSLNTDVAHANLGLHGIGLVDQDHPPGRIGRVDELVDVNVAPLPVREHVLGGRQRFLRRDVADDGEDGVVGREVLVVKRDEIVTRDGGNRVGRAGFRHAIRVEPEHQPVEDGVGDERRILEADLKVRQQLLALPIDLRRRERRMARDIGQHSQPDLEAVLHDDRIDEAQIDARAGVQGSADEVDGVVQLTGRLGCRSLIEQRRRQVRHAELPFRIKGAAGADQEPHADGRLLVVQHDHHLQAVGQCLNLIGREVHGARRQRARCALRRPVDRLRGSSGPAKTHEAQNQRHAQRVARLTPHHRPTGAAPAFADGNNVSTVRFSAVKYVRATRCTSAAVMF